jgi:Vacuolar protein sorting-associated protein 62
MWRRLAVAIVLAAAVPAPALAAGPLARYAPVVVHDSGEKSPLTSVQAFAGRVPGVEPGPARPVVYGRRAGPWLQYWMLFAENGQDRGVLRTGRHEGDWEMVQYRLRRGRLVRAVYTQHSGAESCGPSNVRRARGRPVVFLARGSHAAYFRPGLRDRTWPDPNDEADGRGLRVRPRLVRVSEDRPPWMAYDGRWGATRAGWVPGEMDSPRGPAFQGVRWSDPSAWAAAARPCTAGDCDERGECDGHETAIAAVLAALGLIAAVSYGVRRMRRAEAVAA